MNIFFLLLISFNILAMPELKLDNLTTEKLPLDENSELAASLFLYQLALKNQNTNNDFFGPNICIDYDESNGKQKFKIVVANAVYQSGSSKVDTDSQDFRKLSEITKTMKTYFKAIDANARITATGFTDGEHISGREDTSKANRQLGRKRAYNLANSLSLNDTYINSYISKRGQNKAVDKRKCQQRRVTTIAFEARPKLNFGKSGHYTPSFKMAKDHRDITQFATLSALKLLNKYKDNIDEIINSMPKQCNNSSTRTILKKAKYSALNNKKYVLGLRGRLLMAFPTQSKNPNSLIAQILKNIKTAKTSSNASGKYRVIPAKFDPDEMSKILIKLRAYEKKMKYQPKYLFSDIKSSTIKQSNHPFDCFDIKDYYKSRSPIVNDVSSFINEGQLKLSFTKDDFLGSGHSLKCGQCGSGMELNSNNQVFHKLRTSSEFTQRSTNQNYSKEEDSNAKMTIGLSQSNHFHSMASHKSLKIVIIRNCTDPKEANIFAAQNEIISISKLPFTKTIQVKRDEKVCITNMPVVNTCTIKPGGKTHRRKSSQKKYAHFYSLEGEKMRMELMADNLKTLDYLQEITANKNFYCQPETPTKMDANEIIKTISCKSRNIIPPTQEDQASPQECPQYY